MGLLFSTRRNNNLLHNPLPSQPISSSPVTSEVSAPLPSSSYPPPPPPYVDHRHRVCRTIHNNVHVHKETIKLEVDETSPDCHLLSFTFDVLGDGSITIFYFAREGANCSFSPLYPEAYMPVRIPVQNGLRQKFHQSPGTGINLRLLELNDLSEPSPDTDVFPLIILAESCLPARSVDDQLGQSLPPTPSIHAEITQAIFEKNSRDDSFRAKVVKQILWSNDRDRYELIDFYALNYPFAAGVDNNVQGAKCVICMAEPIDTAVLPCRHMLMCRECSEEVRQESEKCPFCRQAIQNLFYLGKTGQGFIY